MDVNVFELAFKENASLAAQPVKPSKKVVESVARKAAKLAEAKKLKKEAVQLGKIRFTEDTDEISSVQPDDDIVVVYSDDIKPDMTEEEVAQAAKDLLGSTICKCGVCGANYIASEGHAHEDELVVPQDEEEEVPDEFTFVDDNGESLDDIEFADEELGESLLFHEDVDTDAEDTEDEEAPTHTCPVCDATENQVEVGEIVPTEETTEEEVEEETEEETEDEEPVADDEPTEESEGEEAPVKVDVDVNVTSDEDAELSKEAVEQVKRPQVRRHVKAESKKAVKSTELDKDSIAFNERAFSRLLNKFVAENYDNVKSVEITSGKVIKNGELCFEGTVTAKSGKKRAITFETVGFKYTEGLMKIKMIEKGPFTEAARIQKNAVPFVLECKARAGRILPTAFKCRYAVKMANEWFECRGKYTLSETTDKKSVQTELFGLGKKKKSSSGSSNAGSEESKVTFTIYDENGTKQFSHTFTEIPGKMSAEEQLSNVIKDSYPSVYNSYKSSAKRSDWTYTRKSNPASNRDTKSNRNYFVSELRGF